MDRQTSLYPLNLTTEQTTEALLWVSNDQWSPTRSGLENKLKTEGYLSEKNGYNRQKPYERQRIKNEKWMNEKKGQTKINLSVKMLTKKYTQPPNKLQLKLTCEIHCRKRIQTHSMTNIHITDVWVQRRTHCSGDKQHCLWRWNLL